MEPMQANTTAASSSVLESRVSVVRGMRISLWTSRALSTDLDAKCNRHEALTANRELGDMNHRHTGADAVRFKTKLFGARRNNAWRRRCIYPKGQHSTNEHSRMDPTNNVLFIDAQPNFVPAPVKREDSLASRPRDGPQNSTLYSSKLYLSRHSSPTY